MNIEIPLTKEGLQQIKTTVSNQRENITEEINFLQNKINRLTKVGADFLNMEAILTQILENTI